MGDVMQDIPEEPLKVDSFRRIVTGGFLVIAVFFGGFAAWTMAFKLNSAIIAQGSIKIDLNRKTVQHREGGIVHDILVREGDRVTAGQPLVVISDALVEANAALVHNQLYLMLAKLARLDAQRQLKTSIVWPQELLNMEQTPDVRQAMASEESILHEERQALEGQVRLMQQQTVGMQAQVQAEDRIIAAYQEELAAKAELQRNRYLEKTPVLDLQRNIATHQSIKSVTQQRIHEVSLRISEMRRDYAQKGMAQYAEMQNRVVEARERLRPTMDAKSRLEVTAPVAGIVMDMTVFTRGAVIRPGERLMDIVPEGEPLIIEGDIPVKEITKIHIGQATKIQVASYTQSELPPLDGKITYVSPDRTTSRGPMGELPIYKIHAAITDPKLEQYKANLAAGMPVVVYVLTKEKTILGYILDPLTQRLGQAMRE
jgi:HlyD family type I secretion membrane fusion protein